MLRGRQGVKRPDPPGRSTRVHPPGSLSPMEYRPSGRGGLHVSSLCLGYEFMANIQGRW